MKELVLHIGCPKTGSTALQTWLAINQAKLVDQGYHFALTDREAAHFRINSGNAAILDTFIRQNGGPGKRDSGRTVLDLYFSGFDKAIVSSEILSGYRPEYIEALREFFDQHRVQVRVVAYVRNLYDFFYSAHVQHVKRSNRLESFEQAVLEEKHFRHFLAFKNFSRFFPVTLIHYDSVVDNVATAFCDAIGLDYAQLDPLPEQQVNRTLSRDEIVVLQSIGRWLREMDISADGFSGIVSDELVHRFPDTESRAVYSEEVHRHLSQTFSDQLDEFNAICGDQFNFKLSILGERSYLAPTEGQSLNVATLERVVDILCANSARFDKHAIEGIAERLCTSDAYHPLSLKLRKSLSPINLTRQVLQHRKQRIYRLLSAATDRKLLLHKLRQKTGALRQAGRDVP